MQIKHTFLFLFVFGIVWEGVLFAFASGPDPGMNGIQAGQNTVTAAVTCAQSGCHSDFALNSTGAQISLISSPDMSQGWTPGQVYLLTVNIQRSATVYGFQLSAVSDSNNAQVGSLTVPAGQTGRTQIKTGFISGGNVQFAEHRLPSSSSTFTVNWQAPASASAGVVRFNLAGNAANGDGNNTGDRIYAIVSRVSPAAVAATPQITSISPTPAAPAANQPFNFTISGSNFDTTNASVLFTGTGCGGGCQGTIASRTATQIAGSTTLGSGGVFSVTVQNSSGGTASNAVLLTVDATSSFNIANLGSFSLATDGTASGVSGGYARIQASSGTTPSGVLIYGLRDSSGVLVTETGVPATTPIMSGRIYAKLPATTGISGTERIGIAITNANSSDATLTYFFTDSSGNDTAQKNTPIPANTILVRFLDEDPFNGPPNFQGTFSFSSNVGVSVIALRGYYDETADARFLTTTLPVVNTAAATTSQTTDLAQFTEGLGWNSQIVLVNPTDNAITGKIQFIAESGHTITTDAGAAPGTQFNYSIPRRSSFVLKTLGVASIIEVGSVRVIPDGGSVAPAAQVIFSIKSGTLTLSAVGVGPVRGNVFRLYAEFNRNEQTPGAIQTSFAVTNTTATDTSVNFQLFTLDGSPGSGVANRPLPGNGHIAINLPDLFPNVAPFKGILRISGAAGAVMSVVALRQRWENGGRYLMTSTPASDEGGTASVAEQQFPWLVNGSGWSTQFIEYSGVGGQTSSGVLKYYDPSGAPLNLILN